ncbi:MAG: hypothetical protein IJ158_10425 [Treponema sp.]|nr:hypothetical protein [Treponema sp.]
MGTSTSNSGPESNVSFDPPWLNDLPKEMQSPLDKLEGKQINIPNIDTLKSVTAPTMRFAKSRRELNAFLKTSDKQHLRNALGHYSKTGMGGAKNITHRLSISASVGNGLYNFFDGIKNTSNPRIADWVKDIKNSGLQGNELIDKIINFIVSDGGSLDEESCKNSIFQSLSELMENPNIDILNLSEENIWQLLTSFISTEVFNMFCSDAGQIFERNSISSTEKAEKMQEIRDFICADVTVRINEFCQNQSSVKDILLKAVETVFSVYEEEL